MNFGTACKTVEEANSIAASIWKKYESDDPDFEPTEPLVDNPFEKFAFGGRNAYSVYIYVNELSVFELKFGVDKTLSKKQLQQEIDKKIREKKEKEKKEKQEQEKTSEEKESDDKETVETEKKRKRESYDEKEKKVKK
eukprot:gene7791-12265_t